VPPPLPTIIILVLIAIGLTSLLAVLLHRHRVTRTAHAPDPYDPVSANQVITRHHEATRCTRLGCGHRQAFHTGAPPAHCIAVTDPPCPCTGYVHAQAEAPG